ncbi:LD-carboxypeptidase [Streptomyces sp. NBC_00053]|uniref:S66 family peptidase n=1 Tax=unclassified Streptomyces TaxID=2593676 RepID=UPI002258462C|nr:MULTISPECIES: S66 peptidase family protein [unclassified Streptomyces]WSX05479.1 LD-carboxypeptidase [Streptomyces sp. NBC_00987]MCX4392276.1 LD-carboxypeptidase [Streptomyces sp. NBC_01767]MCX5104404.1 LD-carboxypeptidase [Streptomyces sp. NBC_00439]MCX5164546.1 LD-carboxypeptidase [Streptomyces sp. NBC_00305]MCX5223070.1 LD-carboxypeptidase [Streptomyces sp. NBC_00264]
MSTHTYPDKPRPGDRVAVLSPSSGLPGILPLPHELGLRRLREDFGLEPVEYPTTRKPGSTPQERAADIHAAFADPGIKAVISSIGGDDQITVLPHLDRELLRANPKPFFGYSDCTNLLVYLENLGIVGYHGGTVMVELGRPGAMHPLTADSMRAALFTRGDFELTPSKESNGENGRWEDPRTFDSGPEMLPCGGWIWHNADGRNVRGASWGGNLEILSWLLMADREIRPVDDYAGRVLFLETSEEMPSADEVYWILRSMGERGLLRQFPALLMGRAKNWSFEKPLGAEAGERYRTEQRKAVLRALGEYAPETMAVLDVGLGHTDPQQIIPFGGRIEVDGVGRRIVVTY